MSLEECTTEWGVCGRLENKNGPMYRSTIYCKFYRDMEPYLEYLERVTDCANGSPLIVGMDRACGIAKMSTSCPTIST